VIDQYLKMLERLISEDIKLEFEAGSEVKPIFIDEGQFEQVLMNLTVNARDAMPQGGTILIRSFAVGNVQNLEFIQNGQEYVGVSVTDTGVGMDESIQARIFDPFFTTKEHGKGTGLGLSTVYGIVKQSGGEIQLRSKPGSGTTFTLYFPVTRKRAKKSTAVDPAEPKSTLSGAKVLIVDDDPGILVFIDRVLTAKQFEVVSRHSAEDAVATFQKAPYEFDLVLTDVVLTGKSGIELANICKDIRDDIPVVFMSGYPTDKLEDYIQEKSVTLLEKPFQPAKLYSVIENELMRSRNVSN
jgi:CheY-like chemotaxis protein